jgi:hypothetical protein
MDQQQHADFLRDKYGIPMLEAPATPSEEREDQLEYGSTEHNIVLQQRQFQQSVYRDHHHSVN